MGGRGQASRSSGNSRGGQTLSYKNAVMPRGIARSVNYEIRASNELRRDRVAAGTTGEVVYRRNSSGRLTINQNVRNSRRESDREIARESAREKRRVQLEREAWDMAFRNMFSR